jgi:phosphoribosylformylglycinamidine (FGAM) synthase-like enzyme
MSKITEKQKRHMQYLSPKNVKAFNKIMRKYNKRLKMVESTIK